MNLPPSSDGTNLSVQTLYLLSGQKKRKKGKKKKKKKIGKKGKREKKSSQHSRQLPDLSLVTLSNLAWPQELSETSEQLRPGN